MIKLLALQTLKNIIKDKIFWIIISLIIAFAFVPFFSSFSMRQVQEVSITMSLTINSVILLFMAIFGGVTTIWRDIERKFVFTILGNPIKRSDFLIGRFTGFAGIMFMITVINGLISYVVITFAASMYQSSLPLDWVNIYTAFVFQYLKYLLVMAFGFFFASFSTSFFIPFFATITLFIAGNASQGIYDYVSQVQTDYSGLFVYIVKIIYYILPNFSGFDFIANATYALDIAIYDIMYSLVYFILYFLIVFMGTVVIFNRRDLT